MIRLVAARAARHVLYACCVLAAVCTGSFLEAAAPADLAITVRHAPAVNAQGRIEGSIQQFLGESVTINGGAVVTGEFLVPGSPSIQRNGNGTIGSVLTGSGGATPSNYQVLVNGGAFLPTLRTRVDAGSLPAVTMPAGPQGGRRIDITHEGQDVGDWSTVRDLQVGGNAGVISVPPGGYGVFSANSQSGLRLGVAGASVPSIYQFQQLTLNGQSKLEIAGPVILVLGSGVNFNGEAGAPQHAEWLQLRVAAGAVQLNSGSNVYGSIVAPSSPLIINAQAVLHGTAACDRFTLNGGGLVQWANTGGTGGNRAPSGANQTVTTAEDSSLPITLGATDPDGNSLSFNVPARASHGSLTGTAPNVVYTPDADFYGADAFTYTVSDGSAVSTPATVSISVTAVNDSPVANPPGVVVTEDTPLPLTLTASDVDGDILSFIVPAQVLHGTVEKATGAGAGPADYIYYPAPDSTEPDSFHYIVSDGYGGTVRATVLITVNPVDDKPVVAPVTLKVPEDGLLPIVLSGVDPDGDLLEVRPVGATGPFHGRLNGSGAGLVYVPDADFNGDDGFWYEAVDRKGNVSQPAEVKIHVTPGDDAPVIKPLVMDTDEDSTKVFTVEATDVDGEVLTFTVTEAPSHGHLEGAGPGYIYQPDSDFSGEDRFTIVATDAADPQALTSAPVTVLVRVHSVNDAPVAHAQTVLITEDTSTKIILSGVDADGDPLTFSVPRPPENGMSFGPSHGTLFATEDPAVWVYTPAADSTEPDQFTFRVSDPDGAWADATVAIAITPVNDRPQALPLSITLNEDESARVTLSGRDAEDELLSFELGNGTGALGAAPGHGVLEGAAPSLLYRPDHNYFGADGFDYVAIDSEGLRSLPAHVSIEVIPRNDAPVAQNLDVTTDEDAPVEFNLVATDVEGDPVAYREILAPSHGILELLSPGHYRYYPSADFSGVDTFVYAAADGENESIPAAVTLQVRAVNDAPVTVDQNVELTEDHSARILLQGMDVDGDVLAFELPMPGSTSAPAHGTLAVGTSGLPEVIYTPFPDYSGPDSFAFTVRDPSGEAHVGTVYLSVLPDNDRPVVLAGGDRVIEQPGSLVLTAQIQDVDGTPAGGVRTFRWEMLDGPQPVVFAQSTALSTSARFPAPGVYHLRITADDAGLVASDNLTVTVKTRNEPPAVDGGADLSIHEGASAALAATATDDGVPGAQPLRFSWQKISGPGEVTFAGAAANGAQAQASFTAPGAYVLRVTCSDGLLSASDDIRVNVQAQNRAPVVKAGVDLDVRVGELLGIRADVTDDGLPETAKLSTRWEVVSGPGSVSFVDNASAETAARFSAEGTYALRVTASDSELSASDVLGVHVLPPVNTAPVVSAGPNQTLSGFLTTQLHGTVQDDGRPGNGTLVVGWTQLSGPAAASFDVAFAAETGVRFPRAGTYVLQLAASDSELSGNDQLTVVVSAENRAPEVDAGPTQNTIVAEAVTLAGRITDDGLPSGTVSQQWTATAAPTGGSVTFGSPTSAQTTARFSKSGTYVLTLTASDSVASASATTTVTVQDGTGLTVAITKPTTGAIYSVGETIGIETLVQPAADTARVEFLVNGQTVTASDAAPFSGSYLAAENGSLSIQAVAIDNQGRRTESPVVIVSVEDTQKAAASLNGLRWELPIIGSPDVTYQKVEKNMVLNGDPDELYDISLYFRGIVEQKTYLDGENDGAYWQVGGLPTSDTFNVYKLEISDPPQTYYINRGQSFIQALFRLDYHQKIKAYGKAKITLSVNSGEGRSVGNAAGLLVPGVEPYPAPFNGQFVQMDVDKVAPVGRDNNAPRIEAGPDIVLADQAGQASIAVTVSDDGLPAAGRLFSWWTVLQGPGDVALTRQPFDVFRDSRSTSQMNGAWSFGSTPTRGGTFSLLTSGAPWAPSVDSWYGPDGSMMLFVNRRGEEFQNGSVTLPADEVIMHPTPSGAYSVVRWTAPEGGEYIVDGSFTGRDLTSTDVAILLNAAPVFEGEVSSNGFVRPFRKVVTVAAGDKVDFAVGYGRNRSFYNDSTSLRAIISPVDHRSTSASFNRPGLYTLRHHATDGARTSEDDVAVIVRGVANSAPVVSAGTDQTIAQGSSVLLSGDLLDDGLPLGASQTYLWRKVSGIGAVTFTHPSQLDTMASFSLPGTYVLELSANDSDLVGRDTVTVEVLPTCVDVPADCAGWWRGELGGISEIGTATGILNNGVSTSRGKIGNAFYFSGGYDQCVSIPVGTQLDVGTGSGFTVEFWMKPTDLFRGEPVFEWDTAGYGVHLWHSFPAGGALYANFVDTTGAFHTIQSPAGVVSPTKWQHVALTFEAGTRTARIYCDGALVAEQAYPTAFVPRTTGSFLIGGRRQPNPIFYRGGVDELAIYRRALGLSELQAIAAAGSAGKCGAFQGLSVNAGADRVTSPNVAVTLNGSFSAGSGTSVTNAGWAVVSGNASAVTFSDATKADPLVTFQTPGVYTLRFTVRSDSATASDDLLIRVADAGIVNSPPSVSAGPDLRAEASLPVALLADAQDDGLPSGRLTYSWSKVAGPGVVSFSGSSSASATATFSVPGSYTLRLSVSDGQLAAADEVIVQVAPPRNHAPVISAGPDRTVAVGETIAITPTIEDDGLPSGYVLVGWQVISGPGDVALERADDDSVQATFAKVGRYVVRLHVEDTEFTSEDDVVINVTGGGHLSPLVQITNPLAGAHLVQGEALALQAATTQAGSAIDFVEYFVDGISIGASTAAPFFVEWRPAIGQHTITAQVVDQLGMVGTAAPVQVEGYIPPPGIDLVSPRAGSAFTPDQSITVAASVRGQVAVQRVDFFADGVRLGQVDAAPYTFTWSNAANGAHDLRALLVTASGQEITSGTIPIQVLTDPGVGAGLVVEIESPEPGATLTAPTIFRGSVKSPILRDWRIEYRKHDDSAQVWAVFGSGTNEVNAGALGTFDTTLLKNGIFDVRLVATDRFARSFAASSTVLLDGDMKIGQFTVAFQDLQLPLSGIPISVTRMYDSRDRQHDGDFGFGWSLDVSALKLERGAPLGQGWVGSTPDTNVLSVIAAYSISEDQAHSIAITMPDGHVERFRVRWRLVDRVSLEVGDIASTYYGLPYTDPDDLAQLTPEQRDAYYANLWTEHQRDLEQLRALLALVKDEGTQLEAPPPPQARMQLVFEPLPGTHGTLQPKGVPEYLYRADTWGGAMELSSEPEPDLVSSPNLLFKDASGWTYTGQDGRKFEFDAQGRFEKLIDLVGNALTITRNGVFHSSGQSITFHRDVEGRITSITDPQGKTLQYFYDSAGDLRSFYDRSKSPLADLPSTRFAYSLGSHYLTDIFDARGIEAAKNFYDNSGRLYKTVDAAGRATIFGHELGSRTETITDRSGHVTRHLYDERGNITRTESPDGTVTVSGYHHWSDGTLSDLKTVESVTGLFTNNAGQLVPQTVTAHYQYEADNVDVPANDGLLRKLVDPLGNVTRFSYDGRGNLLTTTDARANATGANPTPTLVNVYYPGTNLLKTVTDAAGSVTTYTYDVRGNPDHEVRQVSVTDASGATTLQTLVTDYDYDRLGRLEKVTDATGHATTYERDALGNPLFERTTRTLADNTVVPVVTEHEYDAEGRPVKTWDAEHPRAANAVPTSETVYNELGKPWMSYDALRNVTEQLYNSRGLLETTILPDGTREQTLYDSEGRREYATDRRGKTIQSIYDEVGRLKESWWLGGLGDTAVRLSSSVFDASGRVVRSTDARSFTTTQIYDAAGRRKATVNARGERSDFDYDANGNLRFFTDAKGHTVENQYDLLNRKVVTIYPISEIWNGTQLERAATEAVTAYDDLGRRVGEYEQSPVGQPLGSRKLTRFIYDGLGRLKSVVDPLGQVTSYTHDELGNQLTQTDAKSHTTQYAYDNLGRRKSRVLPGGQSESCQYDDAGRLRFRTDFNGETTELRYDSMGRLRFRVPGTRPQEQVEWRYTTSGQREWMIEASGRTTQYHYDERDRLEWKAMPEGTLSYGYDDAGHVTSIHTSTQDGAAAVYAYDELGRLETVADANGQVVQYGYDLVGNLDHTILPNGVTATYCYNENNRLGSLIHTSVANSALPLAGYSYQVYATGRRRSATESGTVLGAAGAPRVSTYGYDALWRLKTETITGDRNGKNGSIGYNYDAVGNRESRTSTVVGLASQGFGYDADDRVQGDAYDSNGNTRVGTNSQTSSAYSSQPLPTGTQPLLGTDIFDGENRLTQRTSAAGVVQIVYDGDGHKVRETEVRNGLPTTTTYLVDELNSTGYAQVFEEKVGPAADGSGGTLVRAYTYGLDLISQDQFVGSGATGEWNLAYYGYDGHGNVRFLTDASGQITDSYSYDAFGTLLATSGTTPNAYLYCGEQYDSSLGLYYLRARLMNPLTGRFWTADAYEGTQGVPESQNRFAYAGSEPINSTDPTGNWIDAEPLDRAELGVQAHELFFAYCIARTGQARFYDTPLAVPFPDLIGKYTGMLRPDVLFRAGSFGGFYFELKPESHALKRSLAAAALTQVASYGAVLNPRGYLPGISELLVPEPIAIGIVTDRYLQEYEVIISAAAEFTSVGGTLFPTVGMVYYQLLPLPDSRVPVYAEASEPTNQRQSLEYGVGTSSIGIGHLASSRAVAIGSAALGVTVSAVIVSRLALAPSLRY